MSSVQLEGDNGALMLQMHNGVLELRAADKAEAQRWVDALRLPLPPPGGKGGGANDALQQQGAAEPQEPLWGDLTGQPLNTTAWQLGPKVMGQTSS